MSNWIIGFLVLYLFFVRFRAQRRHSSAMPWYARRAWSLSLVFLLGMVTRQYFYLPVTVPTESMEPTINLGDFILVDRLAYRTTPPRRGDLVVFNDLEGDSIKYIKRVIAVGGDQVQYKNKKLTVNGVDEPLELVQTNDKTSLYTTAVDGHGRGYHVMITHAVKRLDEGTWIVPEGELFVMGDNRDNSMDSRFLTSVPITEVTGNAFVRWLHWDPEHWYPHFTWDTTI